MLNQFRLYILLAVASCELCELACEEWRSLSESLLIYHNSSLVDTIHTIIILMTIYQNQIYPTKIMNSNWNIYLQYQKALWALGKFKALGRTMVWILDPGPLEYKGRWQRWTLTLSTSCETTIWRDPPPNRRRKKSSHTRDNPCQGQCPARPGQNPPQLFSSASASPGAKESAGC